MHQNSPDVDKVGVNPELLALLRWIKRALNEVFCLSLSEWKYECCNCDTVKKKVLYWLRVAQLYRTCRSNVPQKSFRQVRSAGQREVQGV
jgi:hypothetical protein